MEAGKLTAKPTDIFTVSVRMRQTKAKTPGRGQVFYLPLTKEIREALGGVVRGEVLTLGVLKRTKPEKVGVL